MRGSLLLVRRRLRRDAALLLTLMVLVACATMLAVTVPRLVVGTVDAGAREEVAQAGPDADVLVLTTVGVASQYQPAIPTDQAIALEGGLPSLLPPALAETFASATLTVLSPPVNVTTDLDVDRVTAQLGMLTPRLADQVTLVSGELPGPTEEGEPVEVLVSADSGFELGSIIRAGGEDHVVVALAEPAVGADERTWLDLPMLWDPVSSTARGTTRLNLTILAAPEGITSSFGTSWDPFEATVRLRLDPEAFDGDLVGAVLEEIGRLGVDPSPLSVGSDAELAVRSEFEDALGTFDSKARGAVAQMSIMIAGVLGVCVVVVLQLSRLLVLRRANELSLERARGASVASAGVRGAIESALVAVLGVGAGLAIVGLPTDLLPVVVLAVAVLLAAPVQAMVLAASGSQPRRVHSDRLERSDVERRRAAARIGIEFLVVALAAAALVSIRSRGLLQNRTEGIDPLLAAAPLLLAAAVTVIVLRVHPPVVRATARVARRSRGVLGILGAMQASRSLAVMPLLALTLSVGLVVAAGMLVETVRTGQVEASWQRVGADVRVDGPQPRDAADTAAAKPGVTAASLQLTRGGVEAQAGLSTVIVTTIAVDERYADLLAQLPDEPGAGEDLGMLQPASDTAPLPILVSPALSERLPLGAVTIDYGDDVIDAEVVGVLPGGPTGYRNDPFVFADLDGLIARSSEPLEPMTLLITGPGAAHAATEGEVLVRSEWLQERQQQAFVVGVQQSMLVAAGAVAALAVFALVAAVQAGSRARGRSLSLLRTLGLRARLGWWLGLAELVPVVVAALVGGILAGVLIVVVCAPSLGLRVLAGGIASPAPSIAPWVIAAVVVAAVVLLALAVLTEVVAHRRDRLSEVLRVGDAG